MVLRNSFELSLASKLQKGQDLSSKKTNKLEIDLSISHNSHSKNESEINRF